MTPRPRCKNEGCENPVSRQGLCYSHWYFHEYGIDLTPKEDKQQFDLNTALSLLSVYGAHLTSCHVWTEVMIDGRLIGPAYPCTCGYAERVAPFLQRMSEVKG